MQPSPSFVGLPKSFWANIRTISQEVGYTQRKGQKKGTIKVPTPEEIQFELHRINLTSKHLFGHDLQPTSLGKQVLDYFEYRADVLNRVVEPLLMNATEAVALYEQLRAKTGVTACGPMNKQSGEMKKPAYFTGMINMLIQSSIKGLPCNYNPQELTTVTRNHEPYRTLARRVDGAFPSAVDPLAVWEIKEYYYTTTFGSRVADGVYETLLDGMELEELDDALRTFGELYRPRHIQHLLMVDAHFTWWVKGRSYLCRIIDMLNMGYVDEALFGREIVERIPVIAKSWVADYRKRSQK